MALLPALRAFPLIRRALLLVAMAQSGLSPNIAAAAAESRQALILAYGGGAWSADALAVSRAALAAGFEVRRIEDPASLPPPPPAADLLLIYLSGQPPTADVAPDAILARYAAARRLAVVAETCGEADRIADSVALPGVAARALVALSATPGRGCGENRVTEALVTALAGPPARLAPALLATGLPVAVGADWTRSVAPTPTESDRDPLIIAAPRPETVPTPTAGGVQVLRAAAPARRLPAQNRAIQPVPPGYPEPSVIVGEGEGGGDTAGLIAQVQVLAGETLGIDYAERERIRTRDPALFRRLLASGGFDPDADRMAAAIQAELQRLDCYLAGVDGIWGSGSRQAVDRYFALSDAQPPGREPDVALFRAIAGGPPDLRCPPVAVLPVVAAPAATTRGAGQPARVAPQAPRQPQPTPPAATGTRRINPNTLGTGIFR